MLDTARDPVCWIPLSFFLGVQLESQPPLIGAPLVSAHVREQLQSKRETIVELEIQG